MKAGDRFESRSWRLPNGLPLVQEVSEVGEDFIAWRAVWPDGTYGHEHWSSFDHFSARVLGCWLP